MSELLLSATSSVLAEDEYVTGMRTYVESSVWPRVGGEVRRAVEALVNSRRGSRCLCELERGLW